MIGRDDIALVDRVLCDAASPQEADELSSRVIADPSFAREVIRQSMLLSDLSALGKKRAGEASGKIRPWTVARGEVNLMGTTPRYRLYALAATLMIVGAGVAIMFSVGGDPEVDAPLRRPTAVLLYDHDANWSEIPGEALPTEGMTLVSGWYELISGSVVIETLSGATVGVTGPASVSLETDMRVFLRRGYLEVRIPPEASGFAISTPTMTVVDLGTEFAVSVDELGDARVDVFEGEVVATALDGNRRRIGSSMQLSAGDRATSPMDTRKLVRLIGPESTPPLRHRVNGPIHLGNLFDDGKSQSLARAVETDTMAAVAESEDLGVWRVSQGGDSVQEVAPGVRVDFRLLGWGFNGFGSIANDAWTGEAGRSADELITGIRTAGSSDPLGTDRIEQGVGMHADALVVFDLDEIRRAGWIADDQALRLRVDRGGVNDDKFGGDGLTDLVVLVITRGGDVTANVNGKPAKLTIDAFGVWQVGRLAPSLTHDGKYLTLDVPLSPSARYLAFVTTAGGDSTGNDHAVFSGARLELDDE